MIWLHRIEDWLVTKPRRADLAAVLMLTVLWMFYFWRALTPNVADQVSYPTGDFSGQFLAFGAYQARRLLAGEIPLWNPYNYAGHPFLADTQAAVFYPPRLATIFISHFTGGWTYTALQAEAVAHYWLAALWMYLFVRTITRSRVAGLVSALTLTYGGYLTGYPPLQLAILEAGIWLPLSLLAVHRASAGGYWHIGWLAISALGLGLSLLAGHPQTTLFFTYVLIAYLIHRAAQQHIGWLSTSIALVGTLGLGYGLAAVQLLPGLEYMRLTVRADLGFEALAGGFPFGDLISLVIPNVVTLWSPLYSGIAALALAGVAIWRGRESARFWGIVALTALVLSFGGETVLYRLTYLIAPGFSWFRGQERAAYVIAHSVAILAGLGTATLREGGFEGRSLSRVLGIATLTAWAFALEAFVVSRIADTETASQLHHAAFFLAVLVTLTWLIIGRSAQAAAQPWWAAAIAALVVFDLFSLTWKTNWEPIPARERVLYNERLVAVVQQDRGLFRVDGRLGLGGNYGTMLGIQDIRGISPLRLNTLERYLTRLPQFRLHQILAVKYVFTDWTQLEVPSTIVASAPEGYVTANLHRLDTPLPRAWMAYYVMASPDEAQQLGWLADPSFDPRTTVTLAQEPNLDLPAELPQGARVAVEEYRPERITLHVETPADGILVLSEWDYPGWQATVDGQPAEILRVDAGLRGLALKAGRHEVIFIYRPLTFSIGIAISAVVLGLLAAGIALGWQQGRRAQP